MEAPRFRCLSSSLKDRAFDDENLPTTSSKEQIQVENSVRKCFQKFKSSLDIFPDVPILERKAHVEFLLKGLKGLSSGYQCLDSSRPWLCYWILNSLELLEVSVSEDRALEIANFLATCQDSQGGFAGGPMQYPHLAPTYAAVNAICILSNVTTKVFQVINRQKLYEYLMRMKTKDGAFLMHEGGEIDIRGVYCALSAARLTNIMTPELTHGTADFIARCQTYEGGFAGCPGMEAHGGYSFCGIAALALLGQAKKCNLKNLLRWTSRRQCSLEGGFQGRTNKLVDGCYSFWQGGIFPILHMLMSNKDSDSVLSTSRWMFHQEALQEYILICCQHAFGGLIDKPGKARDFYHTCYCLSGLSASQQFHGGKNDHDIVIGNPENKLRALQPVYNISVDSVMNANDHFSKMAPPKLLDE